MADLITRNDWRTERQQEDWDNVWSNLRREWDQFEDRGQSTWEQIKSAVRDAWSRVTGR